MILFRWSLLLGGLFNLSMGLIFLSNRLLQGFFSSAESVERTFFHSDVMLVFPSDRIHQLFIHGFGAGVMILGATLIYAAKHPRPLLAFIFFDGLGRILFGSMMCYYVLGFSLMRTILLFAMLEILFGMIYIWGSWFLWKFKSLSNGS